MIRVLTTTAVAVAIMTAAAPAAAQQVGSPWDNWSFVVGAGTDNRSKDVSKSNGEAFVWGQAEWANVSGLIYAGGGFETIESATGSELELDVHVGMRPQIMGFDIDLNAARKHQLDAEPGADDSAWEFTADVNRSIGPVSGRLRVQHSPDGMGNTEAWSWVAVRAGLDVTAKLRGSLEIGRREQDAGIDYTSWNAGMNYALTSNLEAELRYHATDADASGKPFEDALVAGLSFAF